MFRRSAIAAVLALGLTLTGSGLTADAVAAPPTSMAALGDSITRAYNTGPSSYQDYPASSWSTGTTLAVSSHLLRFGASAPTAFNDAVSGAKMVDLLAQANVAASQKPAYVTILMGGNDICTRTESEMTDPALFETQFRAALTALKTGSPTSKVFVASIPNVTNLWTALKGNGSARFIWAIFGICQSLLARPTSIAAADNLRRDNVAKRNVALNAKLSSVCGEAAFQGFCLYDGGAVFGTVFTPADVSTRDYFHPSVNGQKRLSCVTWNASYWAPFPKQTDC
jgi:lysophospholipase L1-like esterase